MTLIAICVLYLLQVLQTYTLIQILLVLRERL